MHTHCLNPAQLASLPAICSAWGFCELLGSSGTGMFQSSPGAPRLKTRLRCVGCVLSTSSLHVSSNSAGSCESEYLTPRLRAPGLRLSTPLKPASPNMKHSCSKHHLACELENHLPPLRDLEAARAAAAASSSRLLASKTRRFISARSAASAASSSRDLTANASPAGTCTWQHVHPSRYVPGSSI